MGWVPPLGECLTALFTKEVTAKMPLVTDMYTNLKSAYSKVQLYLVPAEVIEISTQAMLSMVDLKTVPVGIQIMIL